MAPKKRKAPDAQSDTAPKRATPVPDAPAPPAVVAAPAPPAAHKPHVRLNDVRVGDIVSRHCYYTVVAVNAPSELISIKNLDNDEPSIQIQGRRIPENEMVSASQFSRTEAVTRTEMVRHMEGAKDTVFTVCFHKQATPKDARAVVERIIAAGDAMPEREKMRLVREEVLLGELRTMVGHLVDVEPSMGRSRVVDLQIPLGAGIRERLVDHRTVEWLVLRDVKYVIK